MSAFTKINHDTLPPPVIIQDVNFEDVLADVKSDYVSRYPDAAAIIELESSPVVKLLEVAAYRETVLLNRINQAAKAVMLATARGADLDNLAAIVPLTRLEGEPDASFAARIQLAPEGFSTAGPRGGYMFHAQSAHSDITDVYVEEAAPGTVNIYVLTSDISVDPAIIAAVSGALNADEVRPLTDQVSIKPFVAVPFDIEADITFTNDLTMAAALDAADLSLHSYLDTRRRFGRDVTIAGLYAALLVHGVENVNLISPAADIVVKAHEVAVAGSVTVVGGANV